MMKKMALVALALGLMVGAAQADILLFSGAVYDVFITNPVPVGDGSESLVSFDLKFSNTTGLPGFDPSAFDGVAFGYTGITSGVFNSGSGLHNNYSAAFGDTPTLDNASYSTAIDTHFLDVLANMLVITAPSELTNDIGPSAEATDSVAPFDAFAATDFGSQLTGTFALNSAPTLTVAQIVIKDPGGLLTAVPFGTGVVGLDFFMSGTSGGESFFFDIGVVPEPATMSLLAIGGIGALIRRRR
jgi:hypothetical protein